MTPDPQMRRFERICCWIILAALGVIAVTTDPQPPQYVRDLIPQPTRVCIPIE